MKRNIPLLSLALLLAALPAAFAQSKKDEQKGPDRGIGVARLSSPRGVPTPPRGNQTEALGTIQYDTGVATAVGQFSSSMIGNRFNSQNGLPIQASGTVTQATFYLAGLSGTNAFVTQMDQLNGTTANVVDSVNVAGLALGFNTIGWATGNYTGTTFMMGVWNLNTATVPTNDAIALGTATTGGQGLHGMVINDIVATSFQALQVNALFRATGNIVPVELMEFKVVDE